MVGVPQVTGSGGPISISVGVVSCDVGLLSLECCVDGIRFIQFSFFITVLVARRLCLKEYYFGGVNVSHFDYVQLISAFNLR